MQAPPSATDERLTISIDAMGGDKGPKPVVYGLDKVARAHPNVDFVVHGDEELLSKYAKRCRHLKERITIIPTAKTVTMHDKPSQAMRNAMGTSMYSAIDSVRSGDASVCVSCGNTGALMAISMLRLRKLDGVNRPAIAVLWPSYNKTGFNVVLDVGADLRADPQDLLQYALMGTSYARNGMSIHTPRVGLLNVGTEEHKGRAELRDAGTLLERYQNEGQYDYIGYVEGGDICSDRVDVIVTDGFTGNVALKTGEGTASFIGASLRSAFAHSPLSRLAALLALTSLRRLRKRIDPRRVNGGVFLGLNGIVVKSHGSADATGVAAAVSLAVTLAQSQFHDKIVARLARLDEQAHSGQTLEQEKSE